MQQNHLVHFTSAVARVTFHIYTATEAKLATIMLRYIRILLHLIALVPESSEKVNHVTVTLKSYTARIEGENRK